MIDHILPPVNCDVNAVKTKLENSRHIIGERWAAFDKDPTNLRTMSLRHSKASSPTLSIMPGGTYTVIMEAAVVKLARVRAVVVEAAVVKLGRAATIVQSHYSPITTIRIRHRTLRDTAVPALMATSYGQAPVCMSNVTANLKILFIIGMISLSRQNSRRTTSLLPLQM